MAHNERKNTGSPVLRGGFGSILSALGSAAAGWIIYSRLFINHDMRLPLAVQAEHRIFSSPRIGVVSYYADRSASGRPLVLVHAINAAGSAYEMRPLFERYRGQRPVYALDLPGFGFSERSNRVYTPELYKQALIEFISTQVREPADVVALSLGCEFAARAALERPDLFHSLVFISPSGLTEGRAEKTSQAVSGTGASDLAYATLAFPLWSQAFFDLLATRASIRFFLKQSFVGDVPPDLIEYDFLTAHQPGARYAPLYFVSGKLFTRDILETAYERLSLPVMVLYDRDFFVRFDLLPRLVDNCPNWRAVRITPTLGLPHWERLDETAHHLEAFWREPASVF